MSIEPSDLLPEHHPIVVAATDAIRAFAGHAIDRTSVAIMLPLWQHFRELSDREYRSVLRAFPVGMDVSAHSWLSDASLGQDPDDHGFISGSMGADDA